MKKTFAIFILVFLFVPISPIQAEMKSSSYGIESDVISVSGQRQSSENFFSNDSIGELGTGEARSVNYINDAGFLAMVGDEDVLTMNVTDADADLGTLETGSVKYDTASFTAATTSQNGYIVEFFGNSLANNDHIVDPLDSPTSSSPGNEQFGFNLRQNSNPTVGNDPSGGQGQAASGYDTPDAYKFNSGDTIAQALSSSVYTTYTTSFIGNISGTSDAGEYTTDLTVVIVGRF